MMVEEGNLQKFLGGLLTFIRDEQLTLIEEEEKESENRLSWQVFIRAFYLLKREGIRSPFYPRHHALRTSWWFWWTERYKIGGYPAYEVSLATTKYRDIPRKIEKLPKKFGDKDFKTIIFYLIGARETLEKEETIILTDESTHIYKRVNRKLVKVPLSNKQKKGLLQVLSFIRKKVKDDRETIERLVKMVQAKKQKDEETKKL